LRILAKTKHTKKGNKEKEEGRRKVKGKKEKKKRGCRKGQRIEGMK